MDRGLHVCGIPADGVLAESGCSMPPFLVIDDMDACDVPRAIVTRKLGWC